MVFFANEKSNFDYEKSNSNNEKGKAKKNLSDVEKLVYIFGSDKIQDILDDDNASSKTESSTKSSTNDNVSALKKDGFDFSCNSSEYIGMRTRKFFNGEANDASVTAYLPPEKNDHIPFWHLCYEDKDEEDTDLQSLLRYINKYTNDIKIDYDEFDVPDELIIPLALDISFEYTSLYVRFVCLEKFIEASERKDIRNFLEKDLKEKLNNLQTYYEQKNGFHDINKNRIVKEYKLLSVPNFSGLILIALMVTIFFF
jgi:hypothetical protein